MSGEAPIFTPDDGQGGGITAPDWLGTIPEDLTFDHTNDNGETTQHPLNRHAKLAEFKNPGELGKAYLEVQKLNGHLSGGLQPLAEDATDEQRAEWDAKFRSFMGVPEKGDDYQFDFPDEVLETDERLFGWFRETAHTVGMNNDQVNSFSKSFYEMSKGYWDEAAKKVEAAEAEKVAAVEDYFNGIKVKPEEGVELAKRGFTAMAVKSGVPAEEAEAFAKSFGNSKALNQVFYQLGKQMQEDGLIEGEKPGSGEPVSQADRYSKMFNQK